MTISMFFSIGKNNILLRERRKENSNKGGKIHPIGTKPNTLNGLKTQMIQIKLVTLDGLKSPNIIIKHKIKLNPPK